MVAVAAAEVPVVPETSGFGGALTGQISGEAESSGSKIGKIFGGAFAVGAAAVAAVGAAGVGLVTSVAKSYGDLEQSLGGIETMFKGSADTMISYADNAFATAGLSANEYMQQATSFSAALIQGLGGDTAQAAEVANLAIIDMSDNANKFGTNIGDIQNAYQGFAKGNFTMLDNLKLGYGGTREEMARLVNDSGVLGDSFTATASNLDEVSFDQIISAINTVQTELGITGTTAEEAASTINGSVDMLSNAWANLTAGLGNADADVSLLVENVIDSFGIVLDNIEPLIQQIGASIGGLDLADIGSKVASTVASIVPALIEVGGSVVEALVSGLVSAAPELVSTLVPALTGLVSSVIGMLPQVIDAGLKIIVALVEGVAAAAPTLIPQIVQVAVGIVDVLIQNLPLILDAGLQLLMGLVEGILTALPQLVAALPQIITGIVNFLISAIPTLIQGALVLFDALVQALPMVIEALATAIPQVVQSVVDFLVTAVPMLIEGAITLFMCLLDAIPVILPLLIEAVVGMIPQLATSIAQGAAQLLQAGVTMLGGMLSGLIQKAPEITTWVAGMPGKVLSWLGSTASTLLSRGRDLLAGVLSGLREKVPEVMSWIKGLPASFLGWIGDLSKTFLDSGKKLIGGLTSGITDGFTKAKDAVSSGLSGLRNLLPFSPAKEGPFSGRGWTLYSGRSIMEALAVGITDEADTAQAALDTALGSLRATISPSADVTGIPAAQHRYDGAEPDWDLLASKIASASAKVAKGLQEGVAGHGLSYASRSSLRTVGARP